ncbi:MAG TPA: methyltransferase domain-containing protein [Allosphingosinicella sp.]|nr:methyltransferase domain-containing protein [Allosphingosinicella sp.]
MPEGEIWSQYWHFDRIASCFDGAGQTNYSDEIADGWRRFFDTLPDGARILDLCTGNGAAALIAAETARARAGNFRIVAVDQADIDPASHVSRHGEDYASIIFLRGTEIEALPFPRAGFAAVISQYGIEYTNLEASLPEAVRMIAPGGRLRFVIHAADGVVARDSRAVIADADLLLEEIDLPGHAAHCFEAVLAVERGGGDAALADTCFAAFQAALERTARHVPRAADQMMFRNSGAVLLDTFQRRGHFDLEQLLAKVEQVRSEIAAHRGRLAALVGSALDAKGAAALADRLGALGGVAASRPLDSAAGLIGHVIAARFP